MGVIEVQFPPEEGKIIKWRVSKGTMVSAGRVLLLYNCNSPDGNSPEKKLRATQVGRVTKLAVKNGDVVQPGQVVLTMEGCEHPTVMKDLCAECGADLREENSVNDGESASVSQASIPMVHSVPELKVCPELAKKIGKEDKERLLQDRKLVLLVDLDQTIVHTTNDNVNPNLKDVHHFQLYGQHSPWYHTRLRPNTRRFLEDMSKLYELHICTFGARNYAHTVAALLDRDGKLFSHRILSRDECFDPQSKTANLKALFPCGDDMVCIIDDREDVWQGCGNLVQVKPYHYFHHTGDIHAPPGLEKRDLPKLPGLSATLPSEELQTYSETASESVGAKDGEEQTEESKKEAEKTRADKVDESESNDKEGDCTEAAAVGDSKCEIEAGTQEQKKENGDKNDATTPKEGAEAQEKKIEAELDEDHDDYLLYLEDILRKIHAEFYDEQKTDPQNKSLKNIIPCVRSRVLKGFNLTFSGLVPTHQKLHESRAYKVARAFGANVSQDITEETTHLVAIKRGTAKVHEAKNNPAIKIVNPDWLWTCAERWEHVDERLFPLTKEARGSRIPPPHCSSPERVEVESTDNFADTINPLMSFTQDEIDIMDREVDEEIEDQDTDEKPKKRVLEEGLVMLGNPCGQGSSGYSPPKRAKMDTHSSSDDSENNKNSLEEDEGNEIDDDDISALFRRGGDLPDDLDFGDNSQDSYDFEAGDNEDDREWQDMGAALEREFLSD